MIDCSHANSRKDHRKQHSVCRDVAEQIRKGNRRIIAVMMESNLVAGAQNLVVGEPLVYGQSITDPLMGSDRMLGPGVVPFRPNYYFPLIETNDLL